MAKPGPKPVPQATLEARGSWRANTRTPAPRLVVPPPAPKPPPGHLSSAMKRWWRRVAVEYQLQEQDYLVLQSACENWDLAQGARKTLKKEGLTVEDVKQGVKAHPLVAVARDARAAFNRCLKQLNLQG